MKTYSLNIAGYTISFTANGNAKLLPSPSQRSFICDDSDPDLQIRVSIGKTELPAGSGKVFSAPYVEETESGLVKTGDRFWSVYKSDETILVHTLFPSNNNYHKALVTIPAGETGWNMVIDTSLNEIDPFTYPLDGLLLYYLTALMGDIFIHGSAVGMNGKGYLFTGPSGNGKSTLASLFREEGATVIHDDRVIIRRHQGKYMMHNTPVYNDERKMNGPLDAIFLISHGKENSCSSQHGSAAVAGILSNCIQHHWNPVFIDRLTGAVTRLAENIPVGSLRFVPDKEVISFITGYYGNR